MMEPRRQRVLIVDDERDNVEFLARVFRRDFEVQHASDAKEALALIETGRFDVIITDQMMPGMTGVELLRRSLDLSPECIRIVITGFPDLETAINSVNRGRAYRFFTKPLDREELYTAVVQALRAAQIGTEGARLMSDIGPLGGPSPVPPAELDALVTAKTLALNREIQRLRDKVDREPDLPIASARALRERLEEEVARASRFSLPLSLLALRVTLPPPRLEGAGAHGGAADPFYGPLRGAVDLLAKDGRRFDILGRATDDALLQILPHTDEAGAAARSERVLRVATAAHGAIPRLAHVTRGDESTAGSLWDAVLTSVGALRDRAVGLA